jgi:hypothetical protein
VIGRVLWWLVVRFHGAGLNVTPEMLDAIDAMVLEEMELELSGKRRP